MPRTKHNRNPLGSILEKTVVKNGKKIKVYDVRKRRRGPNGKYKDKTKRCYSYSEALIELGNKQATTPEPVKTSEHTLYELIEYFRTEHCKPAVFIGNERISGYRQDLKKIKAYLDEYKDFFPDVSLRDITYEDIRQYAELLAVTPIRRANATNAAAKLPSPATINRKLSYLRRVLNIGIRKKWLTTNPFRDGEALIRPKAEKARERVLTFEEESALLKMCDQDYLVIETERRGQPWKMKFANPHRHMKLILFLAIDAGLRKSEIFLLRREYVRLDERLLFVPAEITKARRARTIVITEQIENELREYFKIHGLLPKA